MPNTNRSTAIEFVPDSDFSYCRFRAMARKRALLAFYTHEQVEIDERQPMYKATMSNYELVKLARACLVAAGHPDLADQLPRTKKLDIEEGKESSETI